VYIQKMYSIIYKFLICCFEFQQSIQGREDDTRSFEGVKQSKGRFLISQMDLGPDDPARAILTINPARKEEFFNLLNNTLEEAEAMNTTIDARGESWGHDSINR